MKFSARKRQIHAFCKEFLDRGAGLQYIGVSQIIAESSKKLFFGEYELRVNAKNQVTVPARFRSGGKDAFHLMAGRHGCVYLFTKEEIEKIVERLQEAPAGVDTDFARMLYSKIRTVECDPTGRIVLPQELREHAGIGEVVVFVGVARRIELWSPPRWREYKEEREEHYKTRFEGIVEDVFERQR